MACDVCGAKVEYTELLRDCYQTDDIKALCPGCMRIADQELDKLNGWLYRVRRELLKRTLRQKRRSILQPNKRYASEAPHNTEKGDKRDNEDNQA